MVRRTFVTALLCLAAAVAAAPPKNGAPPRPKLVLGIVIDQFRYDYFTRFEADYTGGLARLHERGAVFTNAYLDHYPTVTAIGHSTFLTGATPAFSGIVGNDWFERETGRKVTSVSDPNVKLLGGKPDAEGSSPHRLLVTTIGDELKLAGNGKPRVIGISSKDRAAILPAGRSADGAYWFDENTGNFVSSTYYFDVLPKWVADFNAARNADRFLVAEWTPLVPSPDWPSFSRKMNGTYAALEASPYANELVKQLAERAIEAEQLGARGVTDVLTLSFSGNDYVGHAVGPHAPEVRDIAIRGDRMLGEFFDYIDRKIGMANVLVVFTADHGVAPLPETMQKYRGPGGRLPAAKVIAAMEQALIARFGEGKWVAGSSATSVYFNRELIASKNLAAADVHSVAAAAAAALPNVFRTYTREQLAAGQFAPDVVSQRVSSGFYGPRSADVFVILNPYWVQSTGHGADHGSPFNYDAHVPIVLMGPGIRPGVYENRAAENDIAPTLASILGLEPPGGSVGRVLLEAIE
ncbi:MAG TPA: alkaline phosphatase family protein [Bryobacteraceae bacterium]|nr:alkaline phosphatase family protein [Bryobacteraceae bacterium]